MSREIQFYPVGPQETGLRERMENVFIEIAEERKMNEQENVVPLIENKVLFPEIYDFYGTGNIQKYFDKELVYYNIEYIQELYHWASMIDSEYHNYVLLNYGETSPLWQMTNPWSEILIGIYAHYFCGLNTLPNKFYEYITEISKSYTSDPSHKYPYDITQVDKYGGWVDPVLFPKNWKSKVYRPYSPNIIEFRQLVSKLRAGGYDMRKHIMQNVIKNRLYTKKWCKNEETQKELERYLQVRHDITEKMIELWNSGCSKKKVRRCLIIGWFSEAEKEKIRKFFETGEMNLDIMSSVQGYLKFISEMKNN